MKKIALTILAALAAGAALAQSSPAGWTGSFQKPSAEDLRRKLTPIQYRVTQEDGTERAFDNAYWNEHRQGIYVDVVSGEPLFASSDKFESGTGWPSFTKPLDSGNVRRTSGRSIDLFGVEVRSTHAGSHLGHVFHDGPPPTGLRYCINSAALRFIPADKLAEEGYGQYASLFSDSKKTSAKK